MKRTRTRAIDRKALAASIMAALMITFCLSYLTVFAEESSDVQTYVDSNVNTSVIDDFVKEHTSQTASVAIAVAGEDGIIFQNAYGYADIDNLKAADYDTLYEWAATSKLLVCISVMQLYEQGKIDFEENIMNYLPEGFLKRLEFNEPITIMHLLNNTAGWQEVAADMRYAEKDSLPDLQSALQICEPRQIYTPGKYVAYSNYGIALAGYIVERISGIPFYEYTEKNIFAPLSMYRSSIHPTGADNEYIIRNQDNMRSYSIELRQNKNYRRYNALYPCESAISSFDDMAKFLLALVTQDDKLFQKPETWELMYTPTLFYENTGIPRNAHGFWATGHNNTTFGHAGYTLRGFSCSIAIDTKEKTGVVIMVNQPDNMTYIFDLMNILLGGFSRNVDNIADLPPTGAMDGYYMSARSLHKGFFRIYPLIDVIRITSVGNNDVVFSYLLSDYTMRFTQVQQNVFAFKDGFGVYNVIVFDPGNKIIQTPNWDLIRAEKSSIVFGIISVVLLIIAIILCVIVLVWSILRILISRKSRVKKIGLLEISRILSSIAGIGFIAMLVSTLWKAMNYVLTGQDITINIIYNVCYIILSLAGFSILLIYSKNKEKRFTSTERFLSVFSTVSCVCIVFFIVYWQMYFQG